MVERSTRPAQKHNGTEDVANGEKNIKTAQAQTAKRVSTSQEECPQLLLIANPRNNNLDFTGFDASRFLDFRVGIPRPIVDFQKSRLRDPEFVDSSYAN